MYCIPIDSSQDEDDVKGNITMPTPIMMSPVNEWHYTQIPDLCHFISQLGENVKVSMQLEIK